MATPYNSEQKRYEVTTVDLIAILRDWHSNPNKYRRGLLLQAADEIERLQRMVDTANQRWNVCAHGAQPTEPCDECNRASTEADAILRRLGVSP